MPPNAMSYLTGFAFMLLQIMAIGSCGLWLGIKLGRLIGSQHWLGESAVQILRIGIWLPFLIYWPLPTWPPRDGYQYDPIFWAWFMCLIVAVLSGSYAYLTTTVSADMAWKDARPYAMRMSTLYVLFISLISQQWIFPHGWNWFSLQGNGDFAKLSMSIILIMIIVVVVERLWKSSFTENARITGTILSKELTQRGVSSLIGAFIIALISMGLWQILSAPLKLYLLISSPAEVFEAFYKLLVSKIHFPHTTTSVWWHIMVSAMEVFGGLAVAAIAGQLVFKALNSSVSLRERVLPILPLTYLSPIVLPFFVMSWVDGYTGPWRIVFGVSALAFFPIVEVLWGLRELEPRYRMLVALNAALPFSFVGMIIGETANAVMGVGLLMAVARATGQVAEGIAVSLMIVLLMALSSAALKMVARRQLA